MNDTSQLTRQEWVWIMIFLALLISLVFIAYISDDQVDQEIENYLHPINSKQTF